MRLIYQGKNGEFINEVPARDLDDGDIQTISEKWDLSIAQTEGLLIKRGLYKPESTTKAGKKTESEER